MRVLVADDDPTNRDILRRLLAKLGIDVLSVGDGRAALEALSGGGIDLALLDLFMPVMDGFETARAMRAREKACSREAAGERSHVILVALSGADDGGEALDEGFDEFLQKPIDCETLRGVLERWAPRP